MLTAPQAVMGVACVVEAHDGGLLWSVGESLSQRECMCDRVHHSDTLRAGICVWVYARAVPVGV